MQYNNTTITAERCHSTGNRTVVLSVTTIIISPFQDLERRGVRQGDWVVSDIAVFVLKRDVKL